MASGFPGSIDNFTDPLSNSPLSSPSHSGLHSDVNDAIEKIETYMGLVKVIPTGATNGTVSADGDVTVGNAVSSVTVSGAFSSLYDSYRVLYTGGAGSVAAMIRLQYGSAATAYYGSFFGSSYSASTFYGQNDNNATLHNYIGWQNTTQAIVVFDTFNPFLALNTFTVASQVFITAGNAFGTYSGQLQNSTSYSAFTLSPGSGTFTGGTIRVYGYRN